MNKLLSILLIVMLALGMSCVALSEAPAANSLNAISENVRNNTSFTVESYPDVWITPVFAEYIIGKNDPEKYPAKFLTFAPLEGTRLMDMRYDSVQMLDNDKLIVYNYFAYDRYAFELFLEKAEPGNIVKDGSDGVAIYIQPDSRRGRALIDLKEQFGGTSKMEIIVDSYDRDIKTDELQTMIEAETERVQTEMKLVDLEGYWSENVYQSITLIADRDPVSVTINTEGLTVVKLDSNQLTTQAFVKERTVMETQIELDSYSYAYSKAEDGDEAAKDDTLADGTPYKVYNSDYSGYASFTLLEEGERGALYLTIQIGCTPDEFKQKLEEVYAKITVNS